MKKLTKDQRYYRKKKEEGKRDIVKLPRRSPEDQFKRWKVSRRTLCVRVSSEASEKLTAMSESESIKRWEMLSRILTYKIAKKPGFWYTKHPNIGTVDTEVAREAFNPPTIDKVKYKPTKGSLQLNFDISSIASNKLHAFHIETRYSKARIVQSMILDYELPTEAVKQARQKYYAQIREIKNDWDTERQRQGQTVESKRSNLIDIGMDIIHIKRIPIEHWSDEEIEEYHALMEKKMSQLGHNTSIQKEES